MKLRIFIDTSVIGGCYDEEFDLISRLFFAELKSGKAIAVVSSLTLDELEFGPDKVKRVLGGCLTQ